jgi:imidazoleglycerol-phosphate dehydratase
LRRSQQASRLSSRAPIRQPGGIGGERATKLLQAGRSRPGISGCVFPEGLFSMRSATIERKTKETTITVAVDLDGAGKSDISTGIGFFDHMLDQIARHAPLDLTVLAKGDLHIDGHHTVEDVGLALGQAVDRALGDRKGIARYGDAHVPLDEALTRVVVDVSGRPFLVYDVTFPAERIGAFDTELMREFFQAFAVQARIGLHIDRLKGVNSHHIAESAFKGFARAFGKAVSLDPRRAPGEAPSTKGTLTA